jgi:hypothetical protein
MEKLVDFFDDVLNKATVEYMKEHKISFWCCCGTQIPFCFECEEFPP